MIYSVSIDIDLPRDEVLALLADTDNLYKWQRGLQSFTPLSGQLGQPGSKAKYVVLMNNRKMEMIETITLVQMPSRIDGTYDAPGVHNIVRNRFTELSGGRTRWESENEFHFKSLFMKFIGLLMSKAFPKQSMVYLQDFKAFAERGVDVRQIVN